MEPTLGKIHIALDLEGSEEETGDVRDARDDRDVYKASGGWGPSAVISIEIL